MNPWDAFTAALGPLIRSAVTEALTAASLERPAAHPICVGVPEAARLISVSEFTIRQLIDNGQLRTVHLDGCRRTLIPTAALFELDPAHNDPPHLAPVTDITTTPGATA
jgi:excisionase family DNA binding protein